MQVFNADEFIFLENLFRVFFRIPEELKVAKSFMSKKSVVKEINEKKGVAYRMRLP